MKIKIGSYGLADNLALLTSFKETPIRARGKIVRYRRFFQVQAIIQGTSQSDLTTKINAATAALRNPDGDVGLYHDDGTTPSAHIITVTGAQNGIQLVGDLEWLRADGIEYATQRTFSAAYSATYAGPSDGNILRQSSRYRVVGTGGPKFVHTELIQGLAVREVTNTHSICRAIQSGERFGRDSFPAADAPIASGEQGWSRTVGRSEVKVVGGDLAGGMRPQLLIPGGTFHTARVAGAGDYSLLGTSVWLRAEPSDVEVGNVDDLAMKYPAARDQIAAFNS